MRFVLDCSVTMAWFFEDEDDPYANSVLGLLEKASVVVPAIWPVEVANTLIVGERRKRAPESESAKFLIRLSRFAIEFDTGRSWPGHEHLLTLARRAGSSVYDATYLDVALRHNLPLATIDKRLTKAAMKVKVKILKI